MASAMDADRTTPFVDVKRWRARDRHTGIGKDVGVPYTYEHVETSPAAGAPPRPLNVMVVDAGLEPATPGM